ncbi:MULTISPECIES: GNAT family N-acetyltransferase [unclassified Pseudomonas]|uniref:GNAT family N-acetyltransferase n=1 Tax=unclassified Pseudomonas TaxID=196821 RepID=UPI000D3CAFB3|nr:MULTISPECIES: GNAT family N-acetyltransferase [unclassified Pseudomonas]PTT14808.1 GNAT family N-acetyltransferase [Pseudomonas sp. HMWF034]PVV72761.1 N-acetyltransferase [Pseudomonas sp. HMWF011]
MIRDALHGDAKGIAQVHVSSWQSAYIDLMPAEYLASLTASLPNREASWANAIEHQESDTLVYEIDGVIIGWISVGPCRDIGFQAPGLGEVMAIYILKDHWGKGIGTKLWQAGLKRLSDQGFESISLWVLSANKTAVQFYERLGGKPDVSSRRTLVRGGVTLEEIRYVWVP